MDNEEERKKKLAGERKRKAEERKKKLAAERKRIQNRMRRQKPTSLAVPPRRSKLDKYRDELVQRRIEYWSLRELQCWLRTEKSLSVHWGTIGERLTVWGVVKKGGPKNG
jgi:hypothetical protein